MYCACYYDFSLQYNFNLWVEIVENLHAAQAWTIYNLTMAVQSASIKISMKIHKTLKLYIAYLVNGW